MSKKNVKVLGVRFDPVTRKEALEKLNAACDKKAPFLCVTPNPEICLAAQQDKHYRNILNGAHLSLPDGFGILWAARFLDGKRSFARWLVTLLSPRKTLRESPLSQRVTGTDVMASFCKGFPHRKIFLLGASPEVNKKLSNQLKKKEVQVVGNYSGDDSEKLEPILRSMIDASEAEVLFVAFGAPKQELWLARNLPLLKTVRMGMGIGGAFDFLVGKRKRAPGWMRKWGFEWLFRLLIEPSRWKRIFRATIVFPWKVWRYKEK